MEIRGQEQQVLISPKMLLEFNASTDAKRHLEGYASAKAAADLTEFDGCSDARAHIGSFVPGDNILFRPSIAASGDRMPFRYVIEHPSTKQVVVLEHYADTGNLTSPPLDCGGINARNERVVNEAPKAENGMFGYIDRLHHDLYNQAYREALAVARITDKPILAGALDHLSGLIHPFAVISNDGKRITTSISVAKMRHLKDIYKDGIPDLPDSEIPNSFLEILNLNRKRVAWLKDHNPELAQTQKVQNPDAIVMTTSLIPTDRRYPQVFGTPNTNFGIEMPIVKKDHVITGINEKAFEQDVLAQLEYPILNATNAQSGHAGHGFGRTHRLIIETPVLSLSRHIGEQVQTKDWMKPWLNLPQNQIWIAQVVSGHTLAAEVL